MNHSKQKENKQHQSVQKMQNRTHTGKKTQMVWAPAETPKEAPASKAYEESTKRPV